MHCSGFGIFRQNVGIVKVLTDDSEQEDDLQRRTPRRVRFGGEVVKMRTPDSDSNGTGDEKENGKVKRSTKSAQNIRSFIPVRVSTNRKIRSEPNSPQRIKKHAVYISTPDLSRTKHIFGPKVEGVSKIPRKSKAVFHSTIKITIDSNPKQSVTYKPEHNNQKSEKQNSKSACNKQHLLDPPTSHQGIEILHNLTQSPQRRQVKKENGPIEERKTESNNDKPEISPESKKDESLLPPHEKTDKKNDHAKADPFSNDRKRNFDSFQVCDVNFGKERNASFIPVNKSFVLSSGGSEQNETYENNKMQLITDIMKELQRQVSFCVFTLRCELRRYENCAVRVSIFR